MDILGIGPLEIFFIIVIALIIFGPNDLVKATRSLGNFMRKVVVSDNWKTVRQVQKGMRDLPATLMREAGLEEEDLRKISGINDLEDATKGIQNQISPWVTPPSNKPNQPGISKGTSTPETNSSSEAEPSDPAEPLPESPFSQTLEEE